MKLIFSCLLCAFLSSGLLAQTVSPASARHAEATRQLQQYYPEATPVDLAQLQASQADDIKGCSTCNKKLRPSTGTNAAPTATREQLLAEHDRLAQRLRHLQDAGSTDRALMEKYSIALKRIQGQLRRVVQQDRKAAQKATR